MLRYGHNYERTQIARTGSVWPEPWNVSRYLKKFYQIASVRDFLPPENCDEQRLDSMRLAARGEILQNGGIVTLWLSIVTKFVRSRWNGRFLVNSTWFRPKQCAVWAETVNRVFNNCLPRGFWLNFSAKWDDKNVKIYRTLRLVFPLWAPPENKKSLPARAMEKNPRQEGIMGQVLRITNFIRTFDLQS